MFFPGVGKIMSEVSEKLRAGGIVPCQATHGGLLNRPEIAAKPVNAALNGSDPQRELKTADISALAGAHFASLARAKVGATKLSDSIGDCEAITEPHSQSAPGQVGAQVPFFAKSRAGNMIGEAHCVALDAECATVSPTIARPNKITHRFAAAVAEATQQRLGETV
jgi:putative N-acetylmannosamine-6-phosphate epimerase